MKPYISTINETIWETLGALLYICDREESRRYGHITTSRPQVKIPACSQLSSACWRTQGTWWVAPLCVDVQLGDRRPYIWYLFNHLMLKVVKKSLKIGGKRSYKKSIKSKNEYIKNAWKKVTASWSPAREEQSKLFRGSFWEMKIVGCVFVWNRKLIKPPIYSVFYLSLLHVYVRSRGRCVH